MKTEVFVKNFSSTTEFKRGDNQNNNTHNGIVVGAYIVGSAGIFFFLVSVTFLATCSIGRQCKLCVTSSLTIRVHYI